MVRRNVGKLVTLVCIGLSWLLFIWYALPKTNTPATNTHAFTTMPWPDSLWQTGDLVVRTGTSFFSSELRKFSRRDQTYSHCGWVVRDSTQQLWVYHAIGGTDNPDNSLRKDSLATFCAPNGVSRFAIYRYTISAADKRKATAVADSLYQAKVQFDLSFDLHDDSELYCAEFIWKILKQTSNQAEFISLSRLQNKDYVGIDDLYLNDYCTKIYSYAYQ